MLHTYSWAPSMVHTYGWKPSPPDVRDEHYAFKPPPHILAALPPMVNLRSKCPPIVNQGALGSCTANAIANAHRFAQMAQGVVNHFLPSRLAIYFDERLMEGTVNQDSGAAIRDGFKVIATKGAAPEALCPYNIAAFQAQPSAAYYTEAIRNQALKYQRVDNNGGSTLDNIKAALASGFPVVFGFTVYQSFETPAVAATGLIPMPGGLFDQPVGGHAVIAIGYNDQTQLVDGMNSWSTSWGDLGCFRMPYAYIGNPNLASDMWVVSQVEVLDAPPGPTPVPPTPTPTPTPTPPPPIPGYRSLKVNGQSLPIYISNAAKVE